MKETREEEVDALNDLVINCNELRELQGLLGEFNTFRVLGIEDMEIRHSNILAWLLTPNESHGLRDQFLRRYLMHVSNETENEFLEAVEIDSVRIHSAEILREWQNIDLLIDLDTSDGKWLIVIENKINSKQHSNQLSRYREVVEQAYSKHKKFYLLLSKHNENPNDSIYVSSNYEQVFNALKSCYKEFSGSIGAQPAVLIKNYLTLLEQKFMENSRIQTLAQKIYNAHKLAIDTIILHKPAHQDILSAYLQEKAVSSKDICKVRSNRTYFRFMPLEWNTPKNLVGDAWGANGGYILIEVYLGGKKPLLRIISGHAPYAWVENVYDKTQSTPFKRGKRKLRENPVWVTFDSLSAPASMQMDDIDPICADIVNEKVWKWIEATIQKPDFKKRIKIIQGLIEDLPQPSSKQEQS